VISVVRTLFLDVSCPREIAGCVDVDDAALLLVKIMKPFVDAPQLLFMLELRDDQLLDAWRADWLRPRPTAGTNLHRESYDLLKTRLRSPTETSTIDPGPSGEAAYAVSANLAMSDRCYGAGARLTSGRRGA
jgi:hypothetical protein